MHFQRHRVTDKFARFWDNANNLLKHTKDCPRYHAEDVVEARIRTIAASGVQREKSESGQDCVDIKVDIFGDEKEETIQEKPVSHSLEQDTQTTEENHIAGSSVSVRSSSNRIKAKFGGFMREWYILGYQYAAENAKRNGKTIHHEDLKMHDLLFGMWRVMLDGRITIAEPGAIWVDSDYENTMYQELRKRNFAIEKSLLESEEFFGYKPDFVIRRLWLPAVIEVYGVKNNEQYGKRKENKRKVYKAAMEMGLLIYLEWNVSNLTSWDKIMNELDMLARSTG